VGTDEFSVIGYIVSIGIGLFEPMIETTCNKISQTGLCRARLWDRCLVVHLEICLWYSRIHCASSWCCVWL